MILSETDISTNIATVKQACFAVYADYPIVAGMCCAQAILESRLTGRPSDLALNGNNLFGIKGTGTDGSIEMTTHEYIHNIPKIVHAEFAKNKTLNDSVIQHRHLMLNGTFNNVDRYLPVLDATSIEEACNQIRLCGYATDPNYSVKLLSLYQEWVA